MFYFCVFVVQTSMFSIFFFLMIRRPPRSTLDRSSAASDVYKRQAPKTLMRPALGALAFLEGHARKVTVVAASKTPLAMNAAVELSLIHISEPTRPY